MAVNSQELKKMTLADVEIPKTIKGVTLLTPGLWSGFNYTSENIRLAFQNTDWSNPDVTRLFLGHPPDANNDASLVAGKIENQRMEGSDIVVDLQLWDVQSIINLSEAKLKMGVSPSLKSRDPDSQLINTKVFSNFVVQNTSIVPKPAQGAAAYINLSKKNESEGSIANVFIPFKEESSQELAHEGDAEIRHIEIMKKIGNGEEISEEDREFIKGFVNENYDLAHKDDPSADNEKKTKKLAETDSGDTAGTEGKYNGNQPIKLPKKKKKEDEKEMSEKASEEPTSKDQLKGGIKEMSENDDVKVVEKSESEETSAPVEEAKKPTEEVAVEAKAEPAAAEEGKSDLSFKDLSEGDLKNHIEAATAALNEKTRVQKLASQVTELTAAIAELSKVKEKGVQKSISSPANAPAANVASLSMVPSASVGVQEMAAFLEKNFLMSA